MLEKLDNIVSGDHTDGNIAGSNHGWGFGGSNSKKNLLKREEENNNISMRELLGWCSVFWWRGGGERRGCGCGNPKIQISNIFWILIPICRFRTYVRFTSWWIFSSSLLENKVLTVRINNKQIHLHPVRHEIIYFEVFRPSASRTLSVYHHWKKRKTNVGKRYHSN